MRCSLVAEQQDKSAAFKLQLVKTYRQHPVLGYLVAFVGTVIVFLLRFEFPTWFSIDSFLASIFVVIVLAASYGGQWPGLLVTLATSLCILLIEPEYSYDTLSVILMVLAGSITSVIAQRMHDFAQLANKKQEETLKELESFQSRRMLAIEAASIGDWELDLINNKRYWSEQARRMLGVGPHIEGTLDLALATIHADDRERVQQAMDRAIDPLGDGTYHIEFRIVHPNGKQIWVNSRGKTIFETVNGKRQGVRMYGALADITRLKETEAEIKRSQLWLQRITDATPDVVGIYDVLEDKTVYTNQKMAVLLGYTQEELLSMRLGVAERLIHPDDLESFRQFYANFPSVESGEVREHTHRVLHKNGTYLWFDDRAVPFEYTADGRVKTVLIVARNVSPVKEIEQQLRNRNQVLSVAQQASNSGVWEWDLVNNTFYWTPEYYELHGIFPDTLPSYENWIASIHPDDRNGIIEELEKNLQENSNDWNVEFRILHPKRGERWIAGIGAFLKDDAGTIIRMTGINIDITERQEMQQQLRESEERYRMTFENAAVGIGHVSLDGTWIRANERICQITGYSQEELLSSTFQAITHPDDLHADLDLMQQLIQGQIPFYSLEKRYFRKDTSIAWVKLTVSLLKGSNGSPPYFIAIIEDISAQKAAEEQLREEDRRKDEFIATLAHELRNPMTPILSALQIMKKSENNRQLFDRAKDIMERQLWHMVRLIDDLLDVSRITRNKLNLHKKRILLREAIQHAVESNTPLIQEKSHELTLDLPEEEIFLYADLTRITQVLSNLLANAAKYTLPGGKIRLLVEQQGNAVIIAVKDTGIGIPQESLPHIFEVFVQSENSKEFAQGGLGIGLTLAKQLIEMHNGSISARSDGEGRGSEFVVTLPILTAATEPTSVERIEQLPTPSSSSYRILVVDDNEDIAESFTSLLQLNRHFVQTAFNGLQALTLAEELQPEVILLDIGLPELDGYEVAQLIRQKSWGKNIVLIAVTGWGQESDKQRSKAAGFNAHITKPADPDVLLALIQKLMTE